ncbi:MAG: 50S ribosomal protein L35 [Patescibacteria group bacterium]
MPKLKTPSTIRKRFKVKKASKGGKVRFEQEKAGKSHFNAKMTGAVTRRKRGQRAVHKSNHKNLRTLLHK